MDRAARIASADAGLAETAPGVDTAGKACRCLLVLSDGVAPLLRARIGAREVEVQLITIETATLDVAQVLDRFTRPAGPHRDERLLHLGAQRLVFIELVFRVGAGGFADRLDPPGFT